MLGGEIRSTLKKPKYKQLDKMVYKWFSARLAEDKLMSGHMITEIPSSFVRTWK